MKGVDELAPCLVGVPMELGSAVFCAAVLGIADLLRGRKPALRHRGANRYGMSLYRDVVDWLRGWRGNELLASSCDVQSGRSP